MPRRRILALVTALCVAWTALWPFVTSAHAVMTAEEMPLCHQAGTQVMPGMAPMPFPEAPEEPRVHCPLCIMAFLAGFEPPVDVSPSAYVRQAAEAGPRQCEAPRSTSLLLPPSRAPPVDR
jgi:hypothetical protein